MSDIGRSASSQYQPITVLQLAECLAFTERYAQRRILVGDRRTQPLTITRAQAYFQTT